MKITAKRQTWSVFLALIFFITLLFPFLQGGKTASAAVGTNARLFESRNVTEDLRDAQLDGQTFDFNTFNFDESKETQVISLLEFCYSFYANIQNDYGLYVYVYNPRGLRFELSSPHNAVTLRAGSDETAPFRKYPLKFLNCSQETNYEGLLYKFKVNLTEAQKQEILGALNSTKREYRIGEIELQTQGDLNATSSAVGTSYYFSGYAQGYGPKDSAESTLEMTSEEKDVLSLTPHATWYRPDGTNGKNNYTRDSLHSVYFAVPNDFIKKYGELTAIHAMWLNAVLAPALVTGNREAYQAILPFLGKTLAADNAIGQQDGLPYAYLGDDTVTSDWFVGSTTYTHSYRFGFNVPAATLDLSNSFVKLSDGRDIDPLYLMFPTDFSDNSADDFHVTSTEILKKLTQLTKDYGGELVDNKFSKILFDSYDQEYTELNIQGEDQYSLKQQKIEKSYWDKLFGTGGHVTSSTSFDGIEAIHAVTEEDFIGNKMDDCNRLLILDTDYDAFVDFFNANKEDKTIYLFRYQLTDYICQEASLFRNPPAMPNPNGIVDTNAYFFQETLNLGFDIIDVTFSNGTKSTVIPVGMSPIDVIPGSDPPLDPTKDPSKGGRDIVEIIIAVAILILIAFLVYKLLEWVFTGRKGKKE